MNNQFSRTINKATRGEKHLDDRLIQNKQTIKTSTLELPIKASDHQPLMLQFEIKIQKQLVNDIITNNDVIINQLNKQIKQIQTTIYDNTSLDENIPIDQNVIKKKVNQIINKIKQIIDRKSKIINQKITIQKWLIKSNKIQWTKIKSDLYGKNLQNEKELKDAIEAIKKNLQQRLYKIQQELTSNRAKNPKKYFKVLKNVLGLKNNKEILEPGKKMYKEDGHVTFSKKLQSRIVKKYFNTHYHQNKIDKKNYPKKLTHQDAIKLVSHIDKSLVSTNKACSVDGIKGSAIEIPKLIGINKSVQGYKRILKTIKEIQEKLSKKNIAQLKKNQKIYQIFTKQNQQQQEILSQTLLTIIKKPHEWPKLFEARQIYLPKTEEKTPETCRPITILPTIVKLIETLILTQIQNNKKIQPIDHRQTGFMSQRSTSFNLLRLMGRINNLKDLAQEGLEPIIIFYDFKGAFDSPLHEKTWEVLKKQKYPISIIKQIFWLHGQVKINNQKIGKGYLQGGITTPRLYIQYQQQALQDIEHKLNRQNIYFDYLAFADDLIKTFLDTMKEYGFIINEKKLNLWLSKKQNQQSMIIQYNEWNKYQKIINFKYLGLWIENNGNFKPNENAIKQKMDKYQNVLNKISFISQNTTLIINTWITFIRSQFQYGITVIKISKFKGVWNTFRKKYYQSLAKCLKLFKIAKGEEISKISNIANVDEVEKQYRNHILKQIKKLPNNLITFYGLQEYKTEWEQELNQNQKIIQYQTQDKIKYEVTEAQERHITKQLLNYQGSLNVIQNIFKIKNFQQKRYYNKENNKRSDVVHILMRNNRLSDIYKILSLATKWNIKQEFLNYLNEQNKIKIIEKDLKSQHPEQVFGIPKSSLQNYLHQKQNINNPYQVLKNQNLQFMSLED